MVPGFVFSLFADTAIAVLELRPTCENCNQLHLRFKEALRHIAPEER
jgi:hypothetical protein